MCVCRNEDIEEGYVLKHDDMGLRLTAMQYCKSSESGVKLQFRDNKETDCKFVMAESLPDQGDHVVIVSCSEKLSNVNTVYSNATHIHIE